MVWASIFYDCLNKINPLLQSVNCRSNKKMLQDKNSNIRVDLLDARGYRPCVGIIISNNQGLVFFARRLSKGKGWQFPQGGIEIGETAEEAMFRELYEETGITAKHVKILGKTKDWLSYKIPWVKEKAKTSFVGQKQKWFLLELIADSSVIKLDHSDKVEFDRWQWVSYWYPLGQVVFFKREVYRRALLHLNHLLPVPDLLGRER